MDTIEVENPVVFNCLVDQAAIETTLFIESGEEARNIMSEAAR